MMTRTHIYTRTNEAHGWSYERTVLASTAELERDVNEGFGYQTLLVPATDAAVPKWLDSSQVQADFSNA